MNLIELAGAGSLTEALGWTLVHSVWTGSLAGVLLFLLLKWIPGRRSEIRHLVSLLVLSAFFVAQLWIFLHYLLPRTSPAAGFSPVSAVVGPGTAGTGLLNGLTLSWKEQLLGRLPGIFPGMVSLWLLGIMVLGTRMAGGLALVKRRYLRYARPVSPALQARFGELKSMLGLSRAIPLMSSIRASVPMVTGYFRPVILVPLGLLSGMPPAQLDAILLHELLHICRKDYIINILQSLIEVLFFYHPAVWYLSATIRKEREHVVDDLVIRKLDTGIEYAKALAAARSWQEKTPGYALALGRRRSELMNRAKRILYPNMMEHKNKTKWILTPAFLLLVLFFSLGSQQSGKARDQLSLFPAYEGQRILPGLTGTPLQLAQEVTQQPEKKQKIIGTYTDEQGVSHEMTLELKGEKVTKLLVDGKEIPEKNWDPYFFGMEKLKKEMKAEQAFQQQEEKKMQEEQRKASLEEQAMFKKQQAAEMEEQQKFQEQEKLNAEQQYDRQQLEEQVLAEGVEMDKKLEQYEFRLQENMKKVQENQEYLRQQWMERYAGHMDELEQQLAAQLPDSLENEAWHQHMKQFRQTMEELAAAYNKQEQLADQEFVTRVRELEEERKQWLRETRQARQEMIEKIVQLKKEGELADPAAREKLMQKQQQLREQVMQMYQENQKKLEQIMKERMKIADENRRKMEDRVREFRDQERQKRDEIQREIDRKRQEEKTGSREATGQKD